MTRMTKMIKLCEQQLNNILEHKSVEFTITQLANIVADLRELDSLHDYIYKEDCRLRNRKRVEKESRYKSHYGTHKLNKRKGKRKARHHVNLDLPTLPVMYDPPYQQRLHKVLGSAYQAQ